MHDRTGWERGSSGSQTLKGKTYKKLIEFKRPCATCGEPFSIFVTEKIASGQADSNSFGLKNCEQHRRNKPAAINAEQQQELADLRETQIAWDSIWRETYPILKAYGLTCMGNYADAVKAMAARYELGPALQATANKMPWE